MRTARLRYSGLGIFLLGVAVALLMAWRLNHALLEVAAGLIFVILTALLIARDTLRQTSPESLTSRGVTPNSVRRVETMDPGLRRDLAGILPAAAIRRMSSTRTRRPAAPSAAMTKPARSARTRRPNETIQPDATITLAAERRSAGIDDLFVALDG